jgi:FlaA1/EpsC-like NDP-sugar epimerase
MLRVLALPGIVNLIKRMDEGHSPRWIVFLADMVIIEFSIILAFLLRFNFELTADYRRDMFFGMLLVFFVRGSLSLIFKTYAHIIRHTSSLDVARLILSTFTGSLIFLAASITARLTLAFPVFPLSVIIIEGFLATFLLTNMRLAFKFIYYRILTPYRYSNPVIIIGSREKAVFTLEALELDRNNKNKVIAFADSFIPQKKKRLAGLPIHSLEDLEFLIVHHRITSIVLAKDDLPEKEKEYIASLCKNYDIKMLYAPEKWLSGDSTIVKMKEVNIEELLTRDPINLDKTHIHKTLRGKSILITGAAGSIGSELTRQIARYNPRQLILVDQAETQLYEMELELKEQFNIGYSSIVLADILNKDRMEKIFSFYRPDYVYHAAAYKHVPMLENDPIEAFRNNVIGTRIVADLANKSCSEKFIMISTDKAVNPTGVMGASKRIAEMYVQALNSQSDTGFITTRFGNVLNSNGSVIPRFLKQIREGGPVTVTHPEVTRYFMTIQEACQLVLEASVMGTGGEIFLFDMGEPVKIDDLARKLIRLTGQNENDIKIQYTGLRLGEKLFEELLLQSEPNKPTHHPKIMIADRKPYTYERIVGDIDNISLYAASMDEINVVKLMKKMVPTYKSQNSIYKKYDAN